MYVRKYSKAYISSLLLPTLRINSRKQFETAIEEFSVQELINIPMFPLSPQYLGNHAQHQ